MKLQSCSSKGIETTLKSLRVLLNNPDLREEMGGMGRERKRFLLLTDGVRPTASGLIFEDGEAWQINL